MTLHSRVVAEGAVGDAFRSAFDAPERFGGPKPPKKPKKKRATLLGVLKRAGLQTARIVTGSARTSLDAGVMSFADRVLGEAEKESLSKSLARGVEGMRNIGRATSGEGKRPKFTENPWAHIVHRAAEYQMGKKGQEGQKGKAEQPSETSKAPDVGALLGKGKPGEQKTAQQTLQQVQWDTERKVSSDAARTSAVKQRAQAAPNAPFQRPQAPPTPSGRR